MAAGMRPGCFSSASTRCGPSPRACRTSPRTGKRWCLLVTTISRRARGGAERAEFDSWFPKPIRVLCLLCVLCVKSSVTSDHLSETGASMVPTNGDGTLTPDHVEKRLRGAAALARFSERQPDLARGPQLRHLDGDEVSARDLRQRAAARQQRNADPHLNRALDPVQAWQGDLDVDRCSPPLVGAQAAVARG